MEPTRHQWLGRAEAGQRETFHAPFRNRPEASMATFDQSRDDRAAEHERCLRRLGFEMKPESAGVSYEVAAKPTALPLIARQGPLRRISLRLRGICCFASPKA